jgi:hypothetical protein
MSSIVRSTDIAVRKSPSVSATVYPKGYKMQGNDGNMWVIIVDSRGVHRWQKDSGSNVVSKVVISAPKVKDTSTKKINDYIESLQIIMEDEEDGIEKVKTQVDEKIKSFEILAEDGDEEAKEALNLLLKFKKRVFMYGGEVEKRNRALGIYNEALEKANTNYHKQILMKRISKL